MGGQDFAEIGCVDIEGKGISPDSAGLLGVPVRDAEAPPFIMDKSIEREWDQEVKNILKSRSIEGDY